MLFLRACRRPRGCDCGEREYRSANGQRIRHTRSLKPRRRALSLTIKGIPTLLKTAHDRSVAILTIDRPTRRNAIGSELISQLDTALRTLDRDDATHAIVLTGSAPGFCAGSDLKELGTMDLGGMCHHEAVTAALARAIALLTKPVIAAVEGFALGGGFALATSCDLIVTTPSCRWHMPEVTIGGFRLGGWNCLWRGAGRSGRGGSHGDRSRSTAAKRFAWVWLITLCPKALRFGKRPRLRAGSQDYLVRRWRQPNNISRKQ